MAVQADTQMLGEICMDNEQRRQALPEREMKTAKTISTIVVLRLAVVPAAWLIIRIGYDSRKQSGS
jgi:hypothetical protein